MANQILRLILEGYRERDILEAIKASGPEFNRAMQSVWAELAETAAADRRILQGFCMAACRDLYRRTLEIGDYDAALRAIQALAKIGATKFEGPAPAPNRTLPPPIEI